jgi:hypothetical protein
MEGNHLAGRFGRLVSTPVARDVLLVMARLVVCS